MSGEKFGVVVATYKYIVLGKLERSASVLKVEAEASLRSRDFEAVVCAGFEMTVVEFDRRFGGNGDVVGEERVDGESVGWLLCVVVIDGGVAKGVRIVVEKEHGDFGFVEMVTVVDQSKCEECILVGEEKDLVESFVEVLFIGDEGELTGTFGLAGGIVRGAECEDESLGYGSALLELAYGAAEVVVGAVSLCGNEDYDIAGVFVTWEVFEGMFESGSGRAFTIGDEGLDFTFELVEVVGGEGYFELCGDAVFVEVAKDTKSHLDVGMGSDAVHEGQQYLLSDFDFRVALPFVPHALRAVENNEHTGGFLTGCVLGWQTPCC